MLEQEDQDDRDKDAASGLYVKTLRHFGAVENKHSTLVVTGVDLYFRAGRPMRAIYHQPPTRRIAVSGKDMLPSRRSTMVLRRLCPSTGSGPPVAQPPEFLPAYFPTLSSVIPIFIIPSFHGIFGVLGVQNKGAG